MRSNYADRDAQPGFLSDLSAGVGADATVTVPADVAQFWVVDWILWSYDADVAGSIQVKYAGVVIHEVAVTRGGPGLLNFDRQELYHANDQKKAILNEELEVVLVGAAGAIGKLSVRYR